MSTVVRVEQDGGVAVLVIDNPPINAASQQVRASLLAAILQASSNPDVAALVLIGASTTFIAGSDLREFGQPLLEPLLPQVIAAIESCPKPVVAALHGAALGGGFELALGCDARLALAGTVVGLPEVTLGIIPGAGGTQRLPRLIGIPRAIAMICAGERLPAAAAEKLGLIDRTITEELRPAAVAFALALNTKQRIKDLPVPPADPAEVELAATSALRTGKGRPAVRAAIAAIQATATLPFDEGLTQERKSFQLLRVSREARALRHQFFAERDAARQSGLGTARPVSRIAVIGAGTMGAGIAIAALDAGYAVVLFEREQPALDRGLDRIRSYYTGRVTAGKMLAGDAEERQAKLSSGLDWELVGEADLIIEAVFEDIALKQEVFRKLDEHARPGAILASNTSYTDLDAIAAVTSRPQDVVGLHFFSPANIMRLLEVVRGEMTSPDVLASCLQVAKRLRKVSVVSGNAFGFIGNRIYSAYRRQCEFMLEEGASPLQIDSALEAFGFAMGPFAVADMSGLDIAWRMRQSLAATRDPQARYVQIPDMLCEAGRLGQKTGAGYYRYDQPGAQRRPDDAVDQVIQHARAAKNITPRELTAQEITDRVLITMANEAAQLLHEKVAQRPGDIDVVMVNGYGFPRWEGGPVFWAQERGAARLAQDLGWLAGLSGPGFVRGDSNELFPTQKEQ